MRESIQAHNDYAENVLPKLKRAYLKKCQDVEVIVPSVFPPTWPSAHCRPTSRTTNRSPSQLHLMQSLISVRPTPRVNITVIPQRGQSSPRHSL